ncbi:MAG: patatin-like phospholipase family protein [Chitinophagales bacterium]|nr:patatin-like phospholipase family protein [Chitinophagales bacterium]MDW8272891.1 patatin-like phospholipase family protein [Chitinophagales bacterium]
MFAAAKKYFNDIWSFFPVQLLVVALRKHQIMLFLWILLFAIVVGRVGVSIGIPYLFLDPEYLGEVGYLSFALTGMGFGSLFVTWNIVSYMLHSHRFQFLASLENPLTVFFINNFIIPFIFLSGYVYSIVRFQKYFEFQPTKQIVLDVVGFFAGFVLILVVTALYFQFTNKNVKSVAGSYKIELRKKKLFRRLALNEELEPNARWRVNTFISSRLRVRHTRSVEHYEDTLSRLVFRQHHINALIVQLVSLGLLLGIGFLVEYPVFQIPTAASSFLLASVVTSLIGVFIFWTGGWGTFVMFMLVLVLNELTRYDIFGYQSRAHGLDYTVPPAEYSLKALRSLASPENIDADKKRFLAILNNWKSKNTKPGSDTKPKLVFITASGGGHRSAAFTMAVLQRADSLLNGSLLRKTFMMNGASGGAFALAYYRDLYLQKLSGKVINLTDKSYVNKLTSDLLNPMCINILSNDLFFPIHRFETDGQKYFRDRGYMFERHFSLNTGFPFEKKLEDYASAERSALVPVTIFHCASISDSRIFYMSSQPVRFLMRPFNKRSAGLELSIDAVDFAALFKQQHGRRLHLLSALRMGASFPYILPATVLPSEPPVYVIDGGAVDNFGIHSVLKVIMNFKEWINQNTSGVVIIQTRDAQKEEEPENTRRNTFFRKLFKPIGTLYANLENIQDFNNDPKIAYLNEELYGKIKVILFEYIPEKKTEKASMSLRLTAREKREILKALYSANNNRSFEKLKRILAD